MQQDTPTPPRDGEMRGAELLAALAHTVKTPLQAIMINSELLLELLRRIEDDKLREKAAKILSRIHREAASLDAIVRDFLSLAKLSLGKLLPTDLNELISEVAEFMYNECLEQGVRISLRLDPSIYPVQVDRQLISHALMNLIKNACEAIGRDGTITISTRERGDFVEIEVADDGPGVDRSIERDIFRPFFSTKPAGTGLGLPIAARIAALHGGGIFLRPEPGKGAAFVIRLPAGRFLDEPRPPSGRRRER